MTPETPTGSGFAGEAAARLLLITEHAWDGWRIVSGGLAPPAGRPRP